MPVTFPTRLRALPLWPEWAWAIHYLDKRVENRTWPIATGEWFALHAGKHPITTGGIYALAEMAVRAGWTVSGKVGGGTFAKGDRSVPFDARDVPTSAILGLFRVTCADAPGWGPLGGWRVPDQVGNAFEYRPLREPVACRGAQGLWTVPAEVVERVRAEVSHG